MNQEDFLLGLSIGIGEAITSATVGSGALLIDGATSVFTTIANTIFGLNLKSSNAYENYLWTIGQTNEQIARNLDSPATFYLVLEFANILSFAAGVVLQVLGPGAVTEKLGDAIFDGFDALLGSQFLRSSSTVAASATTLAEAVAAAASAGIAVAAVGVAVAAEGLAIQKMAIDQLGQNEAKRQEYQQKFGCGSSETPREVYNSIKDSPKYPEGFRARQNGTTKHRVNNQSLLDELRKIEPGEWKKVYMDGYNADGEQISIHFFQSRSGKVFDVKVKFGWSN